jgi:hypothetical protein
LQPGRRAGRRAGWRPSPAGSATRAILLFVRRGMKRRHQRSCFRFNSFVIGAGQQTHTAFGSFVFAGMASAAGRSRAASSPRRARHPPRRIPARSGRSAQIWGHVGRAGVSIGNRCQEPARRRRRQPSITHGAPTAPGGFRHCLFGANYRFHVFCVLQASGAPKQAASWAPVRMSNRPIVLDEQRISSAAIVS